MKTLFSETFDIDVQNFKPPNFNFKGVLIINQGGYASMTNYCKYAHIKPALFLTVCDCKYGI